MWNYRLVQFADSIGVCEVYYDDDNNVMGRTEALFIIDEVDELPKVLAMIAEAAKKDVLPGLRLIKQRKRLPRMNNATTIVTKG